ncbi:MAG: thioredoxin domain-containing protein [Leptolyngbyaceae cyanobacterium]
MVSKSKESATKTTDLSASLIKLTGVVAVVAMVITLLITRPAAISSSYTPLSGLMTLKEMAAEAMPYEDAIASPNPTLVEFYADWCTTCQGMSPTIAELHQNYRDRINFVMLDIDDPQWAEHVAQYEAFSVPQFTLLNADEREVKTWVGKVPKPILANIFDQLLG